MNRQTRATAFVSSWEPLLGMAQEKDITLVFSARHIEHNNAAALKSYLEKKLARKTRRKRAARWKNQETNLWQT